MAYDGGIDQQVQQKVDAYRSNPGALQQRYKENQQLMDLLALQKIKSEKEQGAREMQMAMENRPETIAQQREQEVLGLTKQELSNKVDQVSGTMGQKQAVQQKNIQRAAAGQPPAQRMPVAPSAPPQRMAGVASQPASNMARMAGGGIVSFAEGGDVGREQQATTLLASVGISPEQYQAMSAQQQAQVLSMLGQQTTPNMASGGIVGFQQGGSTNEKPPQTPEELLESVGFKGGVERFKELSPDKQKNVLSVINSKRGRFQPDIFDRGMAFLVDAVQSPVVGAVNVASDFLRTAGVMDPEATGFMEQPLDAVSQQVAKRANDPRLQPIGMDRLLPPPPAPLEEDGAVADMSAPAPAPAPAAPPAFTPPTVAPTAPDVGGISGLQPGATTQRATFQDPSKTKLGIANIAAGDEQLKRSIGQQDRDPAKEAAAREKGVGELVRREESRQAFEDEINARKALLARQNQKRGERGPLAGLLASPRSGSTALGRIGQDLYRDQERGFASELAGIDKLYEMRKDKETADFARAGAQVTAGTASIKTAEDAIRQGSATAANLISNRSNELTNAAKGFLEADVANMTAEQADNKNRVLLAISKADNAVKADIANLEATLSVEKLKLEEAKIGVLSNSGKRDLIAKTMALSAKIGEAYAKIAQEDIEAKRLLFQGSEEEKKAMEASVRTAYGKMAKLAKQDVEKFMSELRSQIAGGGTGGVEVIARPR